MVRRCCYCCWKWNKHVHLHSTQINLCTPFLYPIYPSILYHAVKWIRCTVHALVPSARPPAHIHTRPIRCDAIRSEAILQLNTSLWLTSSANNDSIWAIQSLCSLQKLHWISSLSLARITWIVFYTYVERIYGANIYLGCRSLNTTNTNTVQPLPYGWHFILSHSSKLSLH